MAKGALRVLDNKGWLLSRSVAWSRYFIVLNENDREKMKGIFKCQYNGTMLTFEELSNSNKRVEPDFGSTQNHVQITTEGPFST